ncbi:methyl-accepting chemotaxis protein [Halarcobacter ebronensis]|uniref:Chemotaxis protein n=1 Tax=Halarcobacter ebronensis TaxID=1462615 RepID=A0A4Q1AGX4_9BACT|nr:methyl-accepting chemotaxis protein [Halarcobacter ebronensis]QKF82942.1 Cache sensor-containing MCP-domain signal transduction protein [Halarcobacter ebronensis]RXK02860.1 chemotaxis protein [Halarcobacter ebronensis]
MNSVKSKLLALLLISISFSFFILGFYNTSNEYESEYAHAKRELQSLSQGTSKFIDDYLESKLQIVVSVAEMIKNEELTIENQNLIDKLMLAKQSGDFVSVYAGVAQNGNVLRSNGTTAGPDKNNYDSRIRPWYKLCEERRSKGVTEPFMSVARKKLVITFVAPIIKDGKQIGVAAADVFLETIINKILNLKMKDTGMAYLLSNEGKILIHKNTKLQNKESELFKKIKNDKNSLFVEAKENGVEKFVSYSKINLTSWYLLLEIEKDSIFAQIKKNIGYEIILYIVLLIAILSFIYFTLLKLLKPLKALESGLNGFFEYLKGEKSSVDNLNINTKDEFGNMAKRIDIEIATVKKGLDEDRAFIEDVKSVVNRVKSGSLDVQVVKMTSNKSLDELKSILNEMIDTIRLNVNNNINSILDSLDNYSKLDFEKDIENPTGKISQGLNGLCDIINEMLQENYKLGATLENNAKQLLENVDILNRSSNETAASLEETSASIEEITSTIVETTQNISKMVNFSNNLTNSINDGQRLAKFTVESMNEINEQTSAIAEAITVIDQIAFQTNILSLNAAVEAATAGEAGKGFAVVAQEVRNLASRSAEAAKEIKDLVENATTKANTGKKNADEMIDGYLILNENISKTTQLIKQIESAANEQKQGIEQINDAVAKLDTRTQENASVAAHTHKIAIDTSSIAQNIIDSVEEKKFRKD